MNSPVANINISKAILENTWDYEVVTVKRFTDGSLNSFNEPTKSMSTISYNIIAVIDPPVPVPYYIEFAGITQENAPGYYQLNAQNIWFKSGKVSGTTIGVYKAKTSSGTTVVLRDRDIVIRSNSDQYEIETIYDWDTHLVGSIRKIV